MKNHKNISSLQEIKIVFLLFSIYRVFTIIFAYIGERMLPFAPRFPYSEIWLTSSDVPSFIWSFANFDGVHYLTIAKSGYAANFTQVFFPLFPLSLSILTRILWLFNPVVTGITFSSLLFLCSLYFFRKLLLLDYKKTDIAWILLFLILFPTSFYFGALYTESLFFLLVLVFHYFLRNKKWWLAGLIGTLATLTRLNGIFLIVSAFIEVYKSHDEIKLTRLRIVKSLVNPSIVLSSAGLLLYMTYLQLNYNDFLYFWHAQPVFGAARSGSSIVLFPQVVFRYFKIFFSPQSLESLFITSLEFLSAVGGILFIILGYFRKIRLSYLVFSALTLILPTLTGTFSSMPRYILLAFPIFILAGTLRSKLLKCLLLLLSVSLLFILTVLFTRGHWVA